MKQEIAEIWIEALESERFKQGTGQLRHDDDTYCCLGVLCQLAVENGVIEEPELNSEGDHYLYARSNAFLPPEVMDWSGMKSDNGDLGYRSLVALNDGDGFNFSQIAKTIRENVTDL